MESAWQNIFYNTTVKTDGQSEKKFILVWPSKRWEICEPQDARHSGDIQEKHYCPAIYRILKKSKEYVPRLSGRL